MELCHEPLLGYLLWLFDTLCLRNEETIADHLLASGAASSSVTGHGKSEREPQPQAKEDGSWIVQIIIVIIYSYNTTNLGQVLHVMQKESYAS